MLEKYKKVITERERLAIIGLVELGHRATIQFTAVDKAIAEILEVEDGYSGIPTTLLSDAYFDENPDVDKVLKNMEIKVVKDKKK